MTLPEHIFAFNSDSPLLFTQFYFWAFFAVVYALFALIMEAAGKNHGQNHARLHARNVFLMFMSWFFYYKTSGVFLLILLFVTVSDWLIAKQIDRNITLSAGTQSPRWQAKMWLVISVVIDLGILAYFKYAYFGTDMFNALFGTGLHIVDRIVLPVGISFYIFQVISYTADVYHRRIRPVANLLDFAFYVSFFPQLVAGPIVRASEFVPQLYKPFHLSRRQFGLAVFWIINGLAKKIILSDYLAVNFIDRVFDNPLLFSGFENLFALFTYSLQVYADFSGYTDIAIGVALLMGFYLPKNFDSPYKSQNPQEFWRRWHMSLSRWLKTYLYIPLGGNRNATFGTYFWIALIALIALILTGSWTATVCILVLAAVVTVVAIRRPDHRKLLYANLNSFITMLLGGLWHGASWNFMIWGGLNGIGMIVNKFWRNWNWHLRIVMITLLCAGLYISNRLWPRPALNLFCVWTLIVWAGTLLRYLWWLASKKEIARWLGNAWAVVQTFTFITFTRLFFRSGSNLDPATANHEAWETAQNMVNQIGGAWNNAVIPEFLLQYGNIVLVFAIGMIIHWLPDKFKRWYRLNFAMMPLWCMMLCVVTAVFVIYQFITAEMQPFIYFQF